LIGQFATLERHLLITITAMRVFKSGEFVTRVGIYPPLPDADKIQFIPMDGTG
jgi:hypothetical protein